MESFGQCDVLGCRIKYDSNEEMFLFSVIMENFSFETFQLYIPLDWMLYKTLLLQIQLISKPWSAKPLFIHISDGFCNTSKSYHLIYLKFWLCFSGSYSISTSCVNYDILLKYCIYLRSRKLLFFSIWLAILFLQWSDTPINVLSHF